MPPAPFYKILKFSLILLLLAGLAWLLYQLPIKDLLVAFNDQVAAWGVWGFIAFIIVYAIAAVLLIPASILTLGAGFAFGLGTGMMAVSIASTLGATLSFLVSRYVARDKVKQKFGRSDKFTAVDKAVSEQGWKIVALLRLSPIFPYNALNYILGLTGIRLRHYVFASWAGMLPGTLLYVYLGYIGKEATTGGDKGILHWLYIGFGLAATIGVTLFITRIASKALKQADATEAESLT